MNKEEHTKEYFEKMKGMKLSDSSRSRIEEGLREYARFHSASDSVRVTEDGRSIGQVPQGTTFFNRLMFKQRTTMTTVAILIALMIGGGTSYAAESSVPGDILYPVKTEINESVRGVFAFSDSAEAKFHARLVEKRLGEAATLSARGQLTSETSSNITKRIAYHVDEALHAGAEADASVHAAVQADIKATLDTYASTVTALGLGVGNGSASVLSELKAMSHTKTEAGIDVDAEVDTGVSLRISEARATVGAVSSQYEDLRGGLSSSVSTEVDTKLGNAIRAYTDAEVLLENEAHGEATAQVDESLRLANEAAALLEESLEVEVNVNGEVESGTETIQIEQSTPNGGTRSSIEASASSGSRSSVKIDSRIETDSSVNTDVIENETRVETETEGAVRLPL